MTVGKGHRVALLSAGDQLSSSESGVRAVCESDELDQAFETLESGAPPRGLIGSDDPLAQTETSALLRQLAHEQLCALHQRMEELAFAPADGGWIDALPPLLDNLGAILEALEPCTLAAPLGELEFWFATAAGLAASSSIDGPVRAALLSAYVRLATECVRVLALQPERR